MSDVYERLRERLDDFASGYPSTESGIEIKILKGLFTKVFMQLAIERKKNILPKPS